jgi:hypothetical protein
MSKKTYFAIVSIIPILNAIRILVKKKKKKKTHKSTLIRSTGLSFHIFCLRTSWARYTHGIFLVHLFPVSEPNVVNTFKQKQNKIALIVVDIQLDFLEQGSLAVQNSSSIIDPVNDLIQQVKSKQGLVIATKVNAQIPLLIAYQSLTLTYIGLAPSRSRQLCF